MLRPGNHHDISALDEVVQGFVRGQRMIINLLWTQTPSWREYT